MKTPAAASRFEHALGRARRIVIKIGSNQLTDPETGRARDSVFEAIAEDIAALRETGKAVVLVSSGAVALGRLRLGLPLSRTLSLPEKQAAAAVGQILLTEAWSRAFARSGVLTAQTLLSPGDTETGQRRDNARNTLACLLDMGVLPIVNENDTVATEELRYGDNDRLAARIAPLLPACGLVLLSDVDGLYSADPVLDPDAQPIDQIEDIFALDPALAGGPRAGSPGTGGMASKIAAARLAAAHACWTVIARASDRPLRAGSAARLTFIGARQNETAS
ncbi:glutamate 5-kinase [Marinicauda sp. Alg238-R41]|uniref:glutamate 5-kinase n=1 Tax=Marinicauda sp. Alg238-R41 TaxID=2993447 RepID=UPI0022E44487|nr:glutamate 5-kinase [Marinicauda sp. Alg238-R41]